MLDEIRKKIDELDDQIISLLEQRFSIVKDINKLKKNITDSKREKEILNKIQSKNIQKIYKEIFKISKQIQKKY